jgi:hypothetical protein
MSLINTQMYLFSFTFYSHWYVLPLAQALAQVQAVCASDVAGAQLQRLLYDHSVKSSLR